VRRALAHAADKLRELAERYRNAGLHGQSVTLLLEARALAPHGSEASEVIRSALLIQNPGAESEERSSEEHAHALARELAESRVPPKLPKAYTAPAVAKSDASGGCGSSIFWLLLIVSCVALRMCGVGSTRRSTTFPPTNWRANMNVNTNIVIPKLTPMPPIRIPPYLVEPPVNYNAGARARRRGSQTRGTTQSTTPLNINLSPPPVLVMPLNRNAASPSRNTPPRD
jgi:hypothetical protein